MNPEYVAHLNRVKYPPDELVKYAGQHVAWSSDSTRVLLASPDLGKLFEELDRQGIKDYILEYIPDGPSI